MHSNHLSTLKRFLAHHLITTLWTVPSLSDSRLYPCKWDDCPSPWIWLKCAMLRAKSHSKKKKREINKKKQSLWLYSESDYGDGLHFQNSNHLVSRILRDQFLKIGRNLVSEASRQHPRKMGGPLWLLTNQYIRQCDLTTNRCKGGAGLSWL